MHTCERFKMKYPQFAGIPCCEICHATHLETLIDKRGDAWMLCCQVATAAFTQLGFLPVEIDVRESQRWRTLL